MRIDPEKFGNESQFNQPNQAANLVRLHFSQASF